MNKHGTQFSAVLLGLGLLGSVAGCSGAAQDNPSRSGNSAAPNTTHTTGSPQGSAGNGSNGNGVPSGGSNSFGTAGASAPQSVSDMSNAGGDCAESSASKKEGCTCHNGDTAACWTGPAADRNVGMCHDGLQICSISSDNEFATWGPCMGEKLDCGVPDAGMPPPPPPPNEDCTCIPGAIIQCSEDCSVNIVCSLTASKTCLPDGTWSVCHEDTSVTLDLPGVQCRNMLHGCLDVLNPDMPGQNELYVGDCSKQFKCGHAPPPPDTPPEDPPPPDPDPQ